MFTRVALMAPGFALNGCGYMAWMVQKRPPECVIDTITSLSTIANKPRRPSAGRP